MSENRVYRPYSRLVRIRIRDRWFEVPENNILLRCFQYVAPEVPYGPYCWNGDCENDRICFRGNAEGSATSGLSCQTLVREGMEIDEISPELSRSLASAFRDGLEAPVSPREDAPSSDPVETGSSRP